eukprot:1157890-Pelagomonas_calceolata.AAC.2
MLFLAGLDTKRSSMSGELPGYQGICPCPCNFHELLHGLHACTVAKACFASTRAHMNVHTHMHKHIILAAEKSIAGGCMQGAALKCAPPMCLAATI